MTDGWGALRLRDLSLAYFTFSPLELPGLQYGFLALALRKRHASRELPRTIDRSRERPVSLAGLVRAT
jgi:hypothetical protein